VHGLRDGEIGLAGPGGPDAEGDDAVGDGVDVALLARGVRTHRLAPGAAHHLGAQHFARPDVLAHHVDGARQGRRVEVLARLEHEDQLLEEADDDLGGGALHRDAVALHDDLLIGEGLFDLPQVRVAGAEQAGHEVVARDEALGTKGGGHVPVTRARSAP
jgi:hypothetical protein